jgi:hypothetical protein
VRDVDGHFEITYEDDGRGVDLTNIEAKARELSLWKDERRMTAQEATEMLFHPGFSTKTDVSEISGRGVGLDAVRMYYRELGRDVSFDLAGFDADTKGNIPFRLCGRLPGNVAFQAIQDLQKVS